MLPTLSRNNEMEMGVVVVIRGKGDGENRILQVRNGGWGICRSVFVYVKFAQA